MANPQTDRSRHIGVIIAPNRLSVAKRFCDGGDPPPPTREPLERCHFRTYERLDSRLADNPDFGGHLTDNPSNAARAESC